MSSILKTNLVLRVLRAVLTDSEELTGLDKGQLTKDYMVVVRSVKSRGVENVILLRFPELCNDLEQSLESGFLVVSEGPFSRKGLPTIFKPLFDRIFTDDRLIRQEPCTTSIRCLRQVFKTYKKYQIDCPKSALDSSIKEFSDIDNSLPQPDMNWGDVDFRQSGRFPDLTDPGPGVLAWVPRDIVAGDPDELRRITCMLDFVQETADSLCSSFRIRWDKFLPKHGPGAVSEPYGCSKFEFPSWPERLNEVFPFHIWGIPNEGFNPLKECTGLDHSKLIDVPKSYKGPRLIASEPIAAQFIQQGIMQSMRHGLKTSIIRHCYDPYSQDPSRDLVIKASENRSLSTIDLSSASDRLSCWLVERIFRRNFAFLRALNAARTPNVQLPSGDFIKNMKKFAAQGAAFTFPVQSVIYSIICIGVLRFHLPQKGWNEIARMVRVFGDDIIVPTFAYRDVCNVLETLFLKVNRSKSFSKGFFRESCGMDAYAGTDVSVCSVTTHYRRRDPSTLESVAECSNNLYLRGFVRASAILQDSVGAFNRRFIPTTGVDASLSLHFVSSERKQFQKRWNENLHHEEVKVLVIHRRVIKTKVDGSLRFHQWLVENPSRFVDWSGGYVKGVKARYRLRWVPSWKLGSRYAIRD